MLNRRHGTVKNSVNEAKGYRRLAHQDAEPSAVLIHCKKNGSKKSTKWRDRDRARDHCIGRLTNFLIACHFTLPPVLVQANKLTMEYAWITWVGTNIWSIGYVNKSFVFEILRKMPKKTSNKTVIKKTSR